MCLQNERFWFCLSGLSAIIPFLDLTSFCECGKLFADECNRVVSSESFQQAGTICVSSDKESIEETEFILTSFTTFGEDDKSFGGDDNWLFVS